MIKRKLALLGTAVAVSLLMTVPAFAADTKDTDTAQNAQNIQSVQEEKTEVIRMQMHSRFNTKMEQ